MKENLRAGLDVGTVKMSKTLNVNNDIPDGLSMDDAASLIGAGLVTA